MANRTLTGIILQVDLSATVQNTLEDAKITNVKHPSLSYRPTLSSGVNDNQANRGWQSESRSLGSGATETLDMYDVAGIDIGAGAGLDGVGQAVTYEEIVAIAILNENAIAAAGQLEIEPGAANGWTALGSHTAATGGALRGQGLFLKAQPAEAGLDVTDASNHTLKFTANGAALTYSIYILARHDDDESSSSSSSSSTSSQSSSSSSSSSSTSSQSSSSSSFSTSSQSSLSSSTSSLSSSESTSSQSSSSWTT